MYLFKCLFLTLLINEAVSDGGEVDNSLTESRDIKEPKLLDRIASAIFGSTDKKGLATPSRPRPPVHGYGPPPPPPPQRRPPQPHHKVKKAPPPFAQKYTPAASNNFQTYALNNRPQPVYTGGNTVGVDPWQVAQPASMAQIKDLQVQCEKDLMRVRVVFDRPFYGMVFSKGHYSNRNCVHVPAGLGQTTVTFDISLSSCGMVSSSNENYASPQGQYIENTVIIQYDPQLQEVWDQARKLRCTWYDFYEKAVTFKPYQVDMLDPVTANFLGDNLRCWMQIQVGKGPHASEVSGIVKIGQTMTMVLGIKDDENKFDMMVRNCVAHDGIRSPITLVDEKGCVVRPKIMSPFKKIKNFDVTANVLSYAYFQAFKFPDSMNVHFQCVVQVCRGTCPDPVCGDSLGLVRDNSISALDTYGPAKPLSVGGSDSYGAPLGSPLGTQRGPDNGGIINPRTRDRGEDPIYSQASEQKPTLAKSPRPDKITLTEPGYENNFQSRTGEATGLAGGKPRALELSEPSDNDNLDLGKKTSSNEKERTKRSLRDRNGNRILHHVKRDSETERVDVETEKVIRVVAPSDVQFKLDAEDKEEVVVSAPSTGPSNAVCVDTAAFVGMTVGFLMILVIALITIVFLWMRVKSLDRINRHKLPPQ